ncbi:unannotated protein [freshwater metagenome]|uniref:Unannotated protein n=1 Tax=freshwater metagenome TaxID=449393 RepID=A0A6J7NCY8_9ZZZZ
MPKKCRRDGSETSCLPSGPDRVGEVGEVGEVADGVPVGDVTILVTGFGVAKCSSK